MTPKAHILDFVQKLPDDASFEEIVRGVELVAGIREAQEQIARGEGFTAEEVLKELPHWATNNARKPSIS